MDVVLLDFFGTLVDYSPSRVDQGYVRSHALLLGWGADLGYAAFLARWYDISAEFDAASAVDDREFSMHELGVMRSSPTCSSAPLRITRWTSS